MTDFDILWLHDTLRCLPSMRTCTPRITTFVVRRSRVPKNEISFGTLAGVLWGCTKPLAWHSVSSANQIPRRLSLCISEGEKVTRLTIEILAIQTWWNENAEWSNTLLGFQVRESGSLKFQWQNVSILWNKISIVMSCCLQSCATVINEPRFSFVDCEIGEYHFTGAGGYSLVYRCPAHLTTSHK